MRTVMPGVERAEITAEIERLWSAARSAGWLTWVTTAGPFDVVRVKKVKIETGVDARKGIRKTRDVEVVTPVVSVAMRLNRHDGLPRAWGLWHNGHFEEGWLADEKSGFTKLGVMMFTVVCRSELQDAGDVLRSWREQREQAARDRAAAVERITGG